MEDRKNIVKTVYNYLCLKKECMGRGFENLYDVTQIFINEVFELNDITYYIDNTIGTNEDNMTCKAVLSCYEELLLNEMADVLLCGARLISEFGLEEAFSEMVQYKYERQVNRELARCKENE